MDALKVLLYDSKPYDINSFDRFKDATEDRVHITYITEVLNIDTARLALGYQAVCIFVNDDASEQVVEVLNTHGVKLIALRCAGFNNVSIAAANRCNMRVVRVPAYSPHGVAEYAIGLLLTIVRQIHRSYNRVQSYNFAIDGFVGFDLNGKTIGVIGIGKIGKCAIRILKGFKCRVIAFDVYADEKAADELGFEYVQMDELLKESRVIILFTPLTPETYHLINAKSIIKMQRGVVIINCSRGGLIDTSALIKALISGRVGGAGLDVYENEQEYFFRDFTEKEVGDKDLMKLTRMKNVIVTSHQAFLTEQALENIAEVSIGNMIAYMDKQPLQNEVTEE